MDTVAAATLLSRAQGGHRGVRASFRQIVTATPGVRPASRIGNSAATAETLEHSRRYGTPVGRAAPDPAQRRSAGKVPECGWRIKARTPDMCRAAERAEVAVHIDQDSPIGSVAATDKARKSTGFRAASLRSVSRAAVQFGLCWVRTLPGQIVFRCSGSRTHWSGSQPGQTATSRLRTPVSPNRPLRQQIPDSRHGTSVRGRRPGESSKPSTLRITVTPATSCSRLNETQRHAVRFADGLHLRVLARGTTQVRQ